MAEINAPGTPLERREWDAWGNLRASTGTPYPFGWTGEQFDASSDLVYLRARFYSPGTASFLSRDTLQPNACSTTGFNPYAYANNDLGTCSNPTGVAALRP